MEDELDEPCGRTEGIEELEDDARLEELDGAIEIVEELVVPRLEEVDEAIETVDEL